MVRSTYSIYNRLSTQHLSPPPSMTYHKNLLQKAEVGSKKMRCKENWVFSDSSESWHEECNPWDGGIYLVTLKGSNPKTVSHTASSWAETRIQVSSDKFTNPEAALPLELFSLETIHCLFVCFLSFRKSFLVDIFCPYNWKKTLWYTLPWKTVRMKRMHIKSSVQDLAQKKPEKHDVSHHHQPRDSSGSVKRNWSQYSSGQGR